MVISDALRAANERLMQIRAKQGIELSPAWQNKNGDSGIRVGNDTRENQPDLHGAFAVSSQYLRSIFAASSQTQKELRDRVVGSAGWLAPLAALLQPSEIETFAAVEPEASPSPSPSQTVRVSPTLTNAIRRTGMDAVARFWWLARWLDRSGSGGVTVDDMRENFTADGAKFRVCSQQRLGQIVRAGEGIFWTHKNGYLRLHGMSRVCIHFGVRKLTGWNVEIAIEDMTGRLKRYRAKLYEAFHAGRTDNPITRASIKDTTGINERTQREYDHEIGMVKITNYSIDEKRTRETAREHAWQFNRASFEFIDYKGKQGERGAIYNARRMANSYRPTLQCGTNGRKRKVNKILKQRETDGLVINRAQVNGESRQKRLYFADVHKASRATKKGQTAIYAPRKHRNCHTWSTWETTV